MVYRYAIYYYILISRYLQIPRCIPAFSLTILLGHVFCRPCLDSLVSSSPNCPNCRASFGRKSIRRVVCTLQDSPTLDAGTLSEAETMMWQEIESAVESVDEHEQRKSLVRDNSKLAVREAGFSKVLV